MSTHATPGNTQGQDLPALLRCPNCHAPLGAFPDSDGVSHCPGCQAHIDVIEGMPLLVRHRQLVEQAIQAARQDGRAAWYDLPQDRQLSGPYRHHVAKRVAYVEGVLRRYCKQLGHMPSALDLGCGDGNNLLWLSRLPMQLWASDYNLTRLMRARQRVSGVTFFMADVTDYPMLDDSVDIIFFNHVLEHIPDDVAALNEVHRILRPGGLLVLGVPNEGAYFWQLAYRLQPSVRASSDHLHFYTASGLEQKCLDSGFLVEEVLPIGWGLPHWTLDAVVRRWRWVDDLFEIVGRRLMPSQATSLYFILRKPNG